MPATGKADREFMRALELRGIWYRAQYRVVFKRGAPGPTVIDFLIRSHGKPEWVAVDIERDNKSMTAAAFKHLREALHKAGYRLVYLTADDVVKRPIKVVDELRKKHRFRTRADVDAASRKAVREAVGKSLPDLKLGKRRVHV